MPAAFTERLAAQLGHAPTPGQVRAIDALDRLLATPKDRATLILKGYAGTGKTTLVGALVRALAVEERRVVLLAPTGRAAKVLSAYAGAPASTIHRRIYRMSGEEGGYGGVSIAPNREPGALFVVDEASMIGSDTAFGDRDLLGDLFLHVFSAPGSKLLLIGDPAQLPPVGSDHSPALEVKELAGFGLLAGCIELTDVVRQSEASGILRNATATTSFGAAGRPCSRMRAASAVCSAISRVGASTRPRRRRGRAGACVVIRRCSSGSRKAAVLPEPVGD